MVARRVGTLPPYGDLHGLNLHREDGRTAQPVIDAIAEETATGEEESRRVGPVTVQSERVWQARVTGRLPV